MQFRDEDLWAVATGTGPDGMERHFLVYAHRRGFTIRSRTNGAHTTLKELTENNVRDEIALIHRTQVAAFRYRPRGPSVLPKAAV